jgi:hypothetical protein
MVNPLVVNGWWVTGLLTYLLFVYLGERILLGRKSGWGRLSILIMFVVAGLFVLGGVAFACVVCVSVVLALNASLAVAIVAADTKEPD